MSVTASVPFLQEVLPSYTSKVLILKSLIG